MKRIIAIGLAVIAATAAIGTAGAARTAAYALPDAFCAYTNITAGSPVIEPKGTVGLVGGSQRVAFRANLARYDSATRRWIRVTSSSWKAQNSTYGFQDDSWDDLATGRRGVSGTTVFNVAKPGFYAVYFNLYWYRNAAVGASSDSAWVPNHVDLRTNGYGSYCKY